MLLRVHLQVSCICSVYNVKCLAMDTCIYLPELVHVSLMYRVSSCSFSIKDQRILSLLYQIYQLDFDVFGYILFSLAWRSIWQSIYPFLLLLDFLMNTL